MLDVLRRELEMRGVSVAAAERAGVERVDAVGALADSEGTSALSVDGVDADDDLESVGRHVLVGGRQKL